MPCALFHHLVRRRWLRAHPTSAIAGWKRHGIVPRVHIIILAMNIAAMTVLQHYMNGDIYLIPGPQVKKRNTAL